MESNHPVTQDTPDMKNWAKSQVTAFKKTSNQILKTIGLRKVSRSKYHHFLNVLLTMKTEIGTHVGKFDTLGNLLAPFF